MRAANPEKDPKLRLRVVEKGGRPVGRIMMGNSNPTKSRECFREDCGVCYQLQPGGGGGGGEAGGADGGDRRSGLPCSVSNITYKYVCATPVLNEGDDTSNQNVDGQDTPALNEVCGATYFGETSKNMYSRATSSGGHQDLYGKGSSKSFMKNHQDAKHGGEPANFKCTVMQKFRDSLSRQVSESQNIANGMNVVELCNSRAEYHQPQIVRVSRQVQRGL